MSQRIQRRLTKKVQQKVVNKINGEAKANGSPPTNPLEVPHLRRLEADLEQLSKVTNHNAGIFSHGLTVAEMRLRVLERVMNDQLIGEVHTTMMEATKWVEEWGQAADGSMQMIHRAEKRVIPVVDYQYYIQYFAVCMVFTELTIWLKELAAASAAKQAPAEESRSIIVKPGYEDAAVFGGSP